MFRLLPLLLVLVFSVEARMHKRPRGHPFLDGEGFPARPTGIAGDLVPGLGLGPMTKGAPQPTGNPFPWFSWPFPYGTDLTATGRHHKTGSEAQATRTNQGGPMESVTIVHVSGDGEASTTSSQPEATTTTKPEEASTTPKAAATSSALPTTTTTTSSGSSSNLTSFDSSALAAHNHFRALYNATALTWNSTLAEAADKWAGQCNWTHSGLAYGENLAAAFSNVTGAIGGWTAEASSYNSSSPSPSHFTQVVWKSTVSVGCAVKTCDLTAQIPQIKGNTSYYVCEYYPAGNVEPASNIADNVGSPVSS